MGNWNISIHGQGFHHNGEANDADVLAKEFVEKLKAQGQKISRAEFALETVDDLNAPKEEK